MDAVTIEALRRATEPTLVVGPDPGPVSRVAVLAGSFDPITNAHAALADAAREHADAVVLVYSARTLPKEGPAPPPLLTDADRLAMLERFCRTRPGVAVGLCSHGLLADQVAAARRRFGDAQLLLVMGSDKVLQLLDAKWYADRDATLDAMFADARVLYGVRAGEEEDVRAALSRPENRRWADRFERLPVDRFVAAISSRGVREAIARGLDVFELVPAEAREFLPKPYPLPSPTRIVAAGYDEIGARYEAWSPADRVSPRRVYLRKLRGLLPGRARVLELGCGPGGVSRALAEFARVTAVDVSLEQLSLARRRAPTAAFVQADMAQIEFRAESFDAVVALYSITHVPRHRHPVLLARIRDWLRREGVLVATMGAGDDPGTLEPDWLGAPMFFSSFDAHTNRRLVREAGMTIAESDVIEELEDDSKRVKFLWLIARKEAQ